MGEQLKGQQIAARESPRTTKLYDRTNDQLTLDEIENWNRATKESQFRA